MFWSVAYVPQADVGWYWHTYVKPKIPLVLIEDDYTDEELAGAVVLNQKMQQYADYYESTYVGKEWSEETGVRIQPTVPGNNRRESVLAEEPVTTNKSGRFIKNSDS